ncbi:MAG TPA: hypothetical protein VK445_02690 [Dissulfurispiraceae bacterium]|nr:hypothetical protein [Dissulfurispiraceae bacterium]
MFEHRSEPLISLRAFLGRIARSIVVVCTIILLSLVAGMLGYHIFEGLTWIDAFLNAAMLLGGMGPVNAPASFYGKLFAGLYALYCGLIVIVVAGVLLAPIVHRALHRFHMAQTK